MTFDWRDKWGLAPKKAAPGRCRCGRLTKHRRKCCYQCLSSTASWTESQTVVGTIAGTFIAHAILNQRETNNADTGH